MWKPATGLKWQKDALCSKPEYAEAVDWFFSKEPKEKYAAKNLCFQCPVRQQCLQWSLEHRQIWGIWGGKDEVEIRRALSVSYKGEEARRRRFPHCPYCAARPAKLVTEAVDLPDGGRWKTAKIVICTVCEFSWRSRTSVNAVNAYHQDRAEKTLRKQREKEKRLRKTRK